jgi:VRR-NUC domain
MTASSMDSKSSIWPLKLSGNQAALVDASAINMPISQSDYLAMKERTEKARGVRSEQASSAFGDKPGTLAGDLSEDEGELHNDILAECRKRRWVVFHGAMNERSHRTVGEPDFIILADNGRVIFVEAKTRTAKLSPEQRAICHVAYVLGHTVHVCRSFNEFLKVIEI